MFNIFSDISDSHTKAGKGIVLRTAETIKHLLKRNGRGKPPKQTKDGKTPMKPLKIADFSTIKTGRTGLRAYSTDRKHRFRKNIDEMDVF